MAEKELVEAVKRYAEKNYNTGGWDFLVECWSDEEIAEEIDYANPESGMKAATTAHEAIVKIGRILSLQDERRQEARSESGEY